MLTYTERWGELWKLFIKETFATEKYGERHLHLSTRRLAKLDQEFEKFLFKLNENLGIAG